MTHRPRALALGSALIAFVLVDSQVPSAAPPGAAQPHAPGAVRALFPSVQTVLARQDKVRSGAIRAEVDDRVATASRAAAAAAANEPFLFSYEFNQHLKIAGGHFTVGGQVRLYVRYNDSNRIAFSKTAVAKTHPVTPGGAIYVDTTIAAPCRPGNNGYAQAYDVASKRWSKRLPVPICQRID
jgi:hypothetical protein